MKFTITEMSLGEILERGMKLLFRRLPVFFMIELIVLSPTLIIQLILPDVAISPFGSMLVLLPMLILGPIGSAAMLRVITQEYLEKPVGLAEAFQFALGRFLPLLGTSILAGLGIALGMMACCIPGIYLAYIWAFIAQVVVMEDLAGPAALGRSKSLVDGFFFRVFGVLFVVGLLVGGVNFMIVMSMTLALPFQEIVFVPGGNPLAGARLTSYLNFALIHVVSALVNALGQTFVAICTTLLYFDIRNRKEAFNIDHLFGWSDQYRTWRDEPETNAPAVGDPASPPQTGIKDASGPAFPPETGIQDGGPNLPKPPSPPPPL